MHEHLRETTRKTWDETKASSEFTNSPKLLAKRGNKWTVQKDVITCDLVTLELDWVLHLQVEFSLYTSNLCAWRPQAQLPWASLPFFGSWLIQKQNHHAVIICICSTAVRRCYTPCECFGQHRARSRWKTALRGGEGSYRGLGVEGGGAMLEGVRTVAVWSGRRGTRPYTPNWLNGTRSCLERKQMIY